jgi:DNA (cytosine-5)-methyltransferase 1
LEEQVPPPILFERKSLLGDTEQSREEGKGASDNIERSSNTSSYTLKIRGGAEFDRYGKRAGKGALIQEELSGTLGVSQDQTLITIGHDLRSAKFTADGKTDPLTSTDYKEPMIVFRKLAHSHNSHEAQKYAGTDKADTLNVSDNTDTRTPNIVVHNDKLNSIVRRLTPKECERLQGYPDDWTNIGDWTDSKGKVHKLCDSPRYKAIGNSIALPFWEWMAERMLNELGEENPTMGSLFDGIGGFPLVYSRHGCTPVWASEIEEFPIAVTKKHFPEEGTENKNVV